MSIHKTQVLLGTHHNDNVSYSPFIQCVCVMMYDFVCMCLTTSSCFILPEILCETPPVPANCYVKAESLIYRSKIYYKCHKGFAMVSGDKDRTCQSNGSWNGTEPTCAGT